MNPELEQQIKAVKLAKATNHFLELVKVYGRESNAIRALDSISRDEAIATIAICQKVSVFKHDGKVVIQ